MFSPAEEEILSILGSRKMTVKEITEKYYANGKHKESVEPCNFIGTLIRRISKKAEHHGLAWKIAAEKHHFGRRIWKEKI